MHEEETAHNRELWDAYTDDELVALENAIKAHHTPDEMKFVLRWMLPAMSPAERGALVAGLRAQRAAARRTKASSRSRRRTSTRRAFASSTLALAA